MLKEFLQCFSCASVSLFLFVSFLILLKIHVFNCNRVGSHVTYGSAEKTAWCLGIQQISPENYDGPAAIWPSVSMQEALIKVLKRARLGSSHWKTTQKETQAAL